MFLVTIDFHSMNYVFTFNVLLMKKHTVRWEMGSRTQMQRLGFLIIKFNKWTTKTTPKGKNKQAGRQKTGAQSNIKQSNTGNLHDVRQRISTGLQTQGDYIGRQTRVTRETQLEPLKQWLSNKMGGDRQSTWEHMAPTNNKPCAQDRDIWWPAWAHQQDRDTYRFWGWVNEKMGWPIVSI